MRLRVRTSSGVADHQVDPHITFAELKSQLQAASLRRGFPPKPVEALDTDPISNFLSNGEMLVVHSTSNSKPVLSSATSSRSKTFSATSHPPPSSILSNGTLAIRVVPDDNSCLFRSLNAILGETSSSPNRLRTVVRTAVAADPMLYSEGFLGKSNSAYQQWIMSENAWGGAIELSILSQHFKTEFAAFDVKTMRLDRYGEGNSYRTVGYLVYDGIHYNYVALVLGAGLGPESDVTQFDVKDELVAQHVRMLIQKEKDAKRFTDTNSFLVCCGQCGAKLKGEAETLEHAKNTGHTGFAENK